MRGRGGRSGSGHNYHGESQLYVPTPRREHPMILASPSQSEKPVCRFFQRGQCTKGAKCTFPHPADQNGVHTRRNPFVAGQNPLQGGLPGRGESGNRHTTGSSPSPSNMLNCGDDVEMCDCSCNGDEARELAKLKEHLATAKRIIETLCEGDQTRKNQAIAMAHHYGWF